MAKKQIFVIWLTATAFALNGCGTALNFHDGSNSMWLKNGDPRKVYGGVRLDAECGAYLLAEAFTETDLVRLAWSAWVLGIDLPLSAVADTVTLPMTIRAAKERSQQTSDRPGTASIR